MLVSVLAQKVFFFVVSGVAKICVFINIIHLCFLVEDVKAKNDEAIAALYSSDKFVAHYPYTPAFVAACEGRRRLFITCARVYLDALASGLLQLQHATPRKDFLDGDGVDPSADPRPVDR